MTSTSWLYPPPPHAHTPAVVSQQDLHFLAVQPATYEADNVAQLKHPAVQQVEVEGRGSIKGSSMERARGGT